MPGVGGGEHETCQPLDGVARRTKKNGGAHVKLIILSRLDGSILGEGLYDLNSFIEFFFGHDVST